MHTFLLITALAWAPAQPGKEVKTPNYYPLQVGNEWRFKVAVGDKSATAISRIVKIDTINGLALARLEATVNDQIIATEHLRQTPEGIFRHRNQGQEITPPICLLKFPAKPGAKWSADITVGKDTGKYHCETKEETVKVPAGEFKTLRVTIRLESQGKAVNTSYWFVPEVGFVRQTVEAEQLSIVMELEKYTLAKDPKK